MLQARGCSAMASGINIYSFFQISRMLIGYLKKNFWYQRMYSGYPYMLLLMLHLSLRTLAARWTTSLQHLRSQTICSTLFVDKSVQSVMSLIQARGGLPLRLLPGILPVMMSFSKLSVVFLIRCPKYCSFLFTSIPPAFRSTSTLVCFASQGIRITRLYPVVSKASHPYILHTFSDIQNNLCWYLKTYFWISEISCVFWLGRCTASQLV